MLWTLQTYKDNLSPEILASALAFGEFVFAIIFTIPYAVEAARMEFIRGRLIRESVARLEKSNHNAHELKALQQEAEAAKGDTQNWTLLPVFILSIFWGGISTILAMSLGNGSIWILMAIGLFIGIIETLVESHTASFLFAH